MLPEDIKMEIIDFFVDINFYIASIFLIDIIIQLVSSLFQTF